MSKKRNILVAHVHVHFFISIRFGISVQNLDPKVRADASEMVRIPITTRGPTLVALGESGQKTITPEVHF